MKIHSMKLIIEAETTDPVPTGTYKQIAAQIWGAINTRAASTFRVKRLDVFDDSDVTQPKYEIEIVGMEVWGP